MDSNSLVIPKVDAARRFLDEFNKIYPIRAAFWLQEGEEGPWMLYVASDRITDENFDVAYGKVIQIARTLNEPWFDPFDVKVIGSDDPLAKKVIDFEKRHPVRVPIPPSANGGVIGGTGTSGPFFYYPPAASPA